MPNLIFGCGYLGQRIARRWLDAGKEVYVVTRRTERADELAREGYCPILADVTDPASLGSLPEAEAVLWAVGFQMQLGKKIGEVYVDGLSHALDALADRTGQVVYLSSTGVYGQNDGRWVDEESCCEPQREGGQACLEAEQLLGGHRLGRRAIILRLAGLYGPQRIPHLNLLGDGRPIPVPNRGHLNLIHVDDAARVVIAAFERAQPPRTYCVSDGYPVPRREFYREVGRLIGADEPIFSEPDPEASASHRASTDKRVSNRRLLSDFDFRLEYPSYREGLASILSDQSSQK